VSSLDFVFLHPYWAIPLALLPAGLHWWWTRAVFARSESAVLPERHLATVQRVSAVTMLCTIAIVTLAGWAAIWILPVQFLALTSSSYRVRRVLFAETWTFRRYLTWRVRSSAGMFGLWWFVALMPVAVADTSPQVKPWLAVLTVLIALTWHHWNGRVLLFLLGASRLERPDLDMHFAPVFAGARVPTPRLWRAGMEGGTLANAFALVTLDLRGVLFFDTLLEQLTPDEVTAILAHEVAHLEQFTRRRMLVTYAVTAVLIILLTAGSAIASVLAPGLEPWIGLISVVGVFMGIWLRARRMQALETDADLRAIELCSNPEALIRGLTRIHEINHIPRRWALRVEERSTHPSLARRIRTIRARASSEPVTTDPMERIVVASSENGRCAMIDHQRVGFLWVDGDISNAEGLVDRASRVEMMAFDQLSELRLTTKGAAIALIAADRHARRWSMPIHDRDAARVQAALDLVDHLVVAPPTNDLGMARRVAVLIVLLLAASFNAIGAVIVPGLLALRRPMRPMMMALVGALAGTAIASVNDLDVSLVRIGVLAILALMVSWSIRRPPQEEPQPNNHLWTRVEWVGLLIPAGIGLIIAVVSSRDLFGLHAAVRDRAWVTASLAAVAAFFFVLSANRQSRRLGLSIAALATASFVVGSPWFLVNAVADPLVTAMPAFTEKTAMLTALSHRSVEASFSSVRLTPNGNAFVLFGEYDVPVESDNDDDPAPRPHRFVAGGFDGWSREIAALDVAAIDDQRLLVLDRDAGMSRVRAEDLRTGQILWTTTLQNPNAFSVQASPDGRWRALARVGKDFEQFDGQVGTPQIRSTHWPLVTDEQTYVDAPRIDGGQVALAVAPQWEEPTLAWLLADFRETMRILRIDSAGTSVLATSHLTVECPAPPMDVAGFVCVSVDGRSSRFWRVDTSSGRLIPVAETSRVIWKPSQLSGHHLVGVSSGRPTLVDLDSQTIVTLIPDKYCWTQDVGVSADVVVATCSDGRATTVTQYRLPASSH
jgi:Zn-dependent protease with chaperone function